jgi:hypothetical protein
MTDYKRLTKQAGWHKDIDLKDELGYSYIYQRLAELENAIEQGTLIECNPKLIGECIVGIHQYTDGTYAMDLDEENIVIGFCSDGIVTANTTHAYNDYFKHGLYFIDNEEGRAEAEKRLLELQGETKL